MKVCVFHFFQQKSDKRMETRYQDIKVNLKYVSSVFVQQWRFKGPMCYGGISPLDTVTFLARAEDFPSRTAFVQKVQRRGRAQQSSYLDKRKQQWKVIPGHFQ